jgi:hypothetical protein
MAELFRESLVLAGPDHGEVAPSGIGLGGFIEVDRKG